MADRPGGRLCKGRRLDCRVDYLQFCHTAKILEKFRQAYGTTQYHSEDKRDAHHADGIFMEQLGALTKVYNIDKVLSMNRRTVESANLEYAASPVGRLLVTLRAKLRGSRERLFSRPRRQPLSVNPAPLDPCSVGAHLGQSEPKQAFDFIPAIQPPAQEAQHP